MASMIKATTIGRSGYVRSFCCTVRPLTDFADGHTMIRMDEQPFGAHFSGNVLKLEPHGLLDFSIIGLTYLNLNMFGQRY